MRAGAGMVAFMAGVGAIALALALAPLAIAAGVVVPLTGRPGQPGGLVAGLAGPAAGSTLADIPPPMRSLYLEAATRCPGLPWTVLAAIGKIESDHGRGEERSSAGAEGPMQFLPSTWAVYGVDGDGDGVASVWDAADAVPAAADYLCANGGGDAARLASAIFQYNHDDRYVQRVLALSAAYATVASPAG